MLSGQYLIFVPNCYPFIRFGNILGKFGSIQCMLPKCSKKSTVFQTQIQPRICCQWELPVDNSRWCTNLAKVKQNKELKEFQNQDKWYRSFQGQFQENLEISEFLKANQKFWKFRDGTEILFSKILMYLARLSSFLEIQTRIFYQMESAQYIVFLALTNFIYLVNFQ